MAPDSPESFQKIADVLTNSLKKGFQEVCPERYGAPLSLRRVDDSSDSQTVSFALEGRIELHIHVTVTHVGGNVYDIETKVEDGDVQCFTYSEPDASGSSLSIAPYLGRKIAKHLLDEVERHLGKKILCNQIDELVSSAA